MFPLCLFVTIVFGSHHVLCQENTEKTRMSSSALPTQCVFNSFLCKPSGLAVVKTLMNISSVSECQETCQGNKNCNFVTFTNFRNIATCHLLSSCEDKVCVVTSSYNNVQWKNHSWMFCFIQVPSCFSLEQCSSAPKSCSANSEFNKKCPKLMPPPAETRGGLAAWSCDGVNPYHDDIPAGSLCHTS